MAAHTYLNSRSPSVSFAKPSSTAHHRVQLQRVAQKTRRTDDEKSMWQSGIMQCNSRSKTNLLTLLVVLTSLLSVVAAQDLPYGIVRRAPSFADLGARRLIERATKKTSTAETTATTAESVASTTSTETESTSTTSTLATATSTTLPQAFDTSLGNNFTDTSCPNFFNKFLSDSAFQACYPFSLLLETSHAFFEDEKNFYDLTNDLQASCNVNATDCNNLLQALATELISDDNCGTDYGKENPLVVEAYTGMISYPVLYEATCMKNSDGDYCYADAVTLQDNMTVADSYPYYLPLGTTLPGGAPLTCNTCLKQTMEIFHSYSSNKTLPISKTYLSAAQLINIDCGPSWVPSSLRVTSSSTSLSTQYYTVLLSFFVSCAFAATWL